MAASVKKYYVWILWLLVLTGLVYWLSPQGVPNAKTSTQANVSSAGVSGGNAPVAGFGVSHSQRSGERSSAKAEVDAQSPAHINAQTWALSAIPDVPALPLPEAVSIYSYVQIEDVLPSVGQVLQMPLPGGANTGIAVEVARAQALSNGDYTWSGYVQGQGGDYPVVMTQGKSGAFATITTPEGSYSLETLNGSGWLYKNPAEDELRLPNKEDFLEVPDAPHHDHTHPPHRRIP